MPNRRACRCPIGDRGRAAQRESGAARPRRTGGLGGLPLGVQVMGQPGADAKTTAIARWLGEAITPVSV